MREGGLRSAREAPREQRAGGAGAVGGRRKAGTGAARMRRKKYKGAVAAGVGVCEMRQEERLCRK